MKIVQCPVSRGEKQMPFDSSTGRTSGDAESKVQSLLGCCRRAPGRWVSRKARKEKLSPPSLLNKIHGPRRASPNAISATSWRSPRTNSKPRPSIPPIKGILAADPRRSSRINLKPDPGNQKNEYLTCRTVFSRPLVPPQAGLTQADFREIPLLHQIEYFLTLLPP